MSARHHHMTVGRAVLSLAILAMFGVVPAVAQQRTTATYDDWTVLCEQQAGVPTRRCEVGQEISIPNQDKQLTMIAYVAIGAASAQQEKNIAVKLPLGVFLPANVTIAGASDKPKLALSYQHCLADGCVATAPIDEAALTTLRAGGAPMTIAFDLLRGEGRQAIQLRVSLKGLGEAVDALARE